MNNNNKNVISLYRSTWKKVTLKTVVILAQHLTHHLIQPKHHEWMIPEAGIFVYAEQVHHFLLLDSINKTYLQTTAFPWFTCICTKCSYLCIYLCYLRGFLYLKILWHITNYQHFLNITLKITFKHNYSKQRSCNYMCIKQGTFINILDLIVYKSPFLFPYLEHACFISVNQPSNFYTFPSKLKQEF